MKYLAIVTLLVMVSGCASTSLSDESKCAARLTELQEHIDSAWDAAEKSCIDRVSAIRKAAGETVAIECWAAKLRAGGITSYSVEEAADAYATATSDAADAPMAEASRTTRITEAEIARLKSSLCSDSPGEAALRDAP